MKLVITFILGILVGFGVSQLNTPESKLKTEQVVVPDSTTVELKNKLQVLTETEIEDYYRLKTMEERYQKADEILGKIVLLLLKDIGLRISENAKKEINNPNRNSEIEPVRKVEVIEKTLYEPSISRGFNRRWKLNDSEKKLSEIRSPLQAGEFLNEVKIDDFARELSNSSDFSNKNNNLLDVTGKYLGVAQVIVNNKNKTWDVEIDISGELSNSKLRGNSSIKISENGSVFSNSRDRGIIQSLNEFSNDSQGTLIRASPSLYFQVYYIKALDSLIGNVYSSGKKNSYERIGTVELKRP